MGAGGCSASGLYGIIWLWDVRTGKQIRRLDAEVASSIESQKQSKPFIHWRDRIFARSREAYLLDFLSGDGPGRCGDSVINNS